MGRQIYNLGTGKKGKPEEIKADRSFDVLPFS